MRGYCSFPFTIPCSGTRGGNYEPPLCFTSLSPCSFVQEQDTDEGNDLVALCHRHIDLLFRGMWLGTLFTEPCHKSKLQNNNTGYSNAQ